MVINDRNVAAELAFFKTSIKNNVSIGFQLDKCMLLKW